MSVKNKVNAPLRLETLKSYTRELFTPIGRGECVSTVWPVMAGRRIRNKFLINYPDLFKEEIGNPAKYLLVYVEPLDLTEESAEGYLKLISSSIIEEYAKKHDASKIETSNAVSYSELLDNLAKVIKQINEKGLEIVLFLGEFDELGFANSIFYNNLKSLWVKANRKLHYVFMLLMDITQGECLKAFGELNELLLANVVFVSISDEKDADYMIDRFSIELQRPFSPDERELLKDICGGHPYLLKSCTRLIALMNGHKMLTTQVKEILLTHFEPRSACQKVFNLLTDGEKVILGQITKGSVKELPVGARTMSALGIIKKDGLGIWRPFGELFASIVLEEGLTPLISTAIEVNTTGLTFDQKSGAIFFNGRNIEEKFTRQEYEILRFLLAEPDKLRSRDEVGEAMWGKNSYDRYSDWAIDQVMSKIRKKLKSLGAESLLQTVRGRGYKLTVI